jgi:hypothetical protein
MLHYLSNLKRGNYSKLQENAKFRTLYLIIFLFKLGTDHNLSIHWQNSPIGLQLGKRLVKELDFNLSWSSQTPILNKAQTNIIILRLGHKKLEKAQLTFRRCILNIYSTNIRIQYFKHGP